MKKKNDIDAPTMNELGGMLPEENATRKIAINKPMEVDFRIIFDRAADGILLVDYDTKQLRLSNPKIQQMLGYSEAELSDLTLEDIHPEDQMPYMLERLRKRLIGDESASHSQLLRKDGSAFYAEIRGSICQIQNHSYILSFVRDVTEKILSDKRHHEISERNTSIIQTAMDGFFVLDMRGHLLEVNETWRFWVCVGIFH